jgi:imidazolonepropionase-like amidohydrolase
VTGGAVGAQSATQAGNGSLAIEHVTVIPMVRDTTLIDQTVLVAGDRIVWIGPAAEARVPAGARRIDGRGRFLIPGLADMHVHIDHVEDLARWVAAGVTTVRNMRGHPEHLRYRQQIARGEVVGPTIFTTGPTCCHGIFAKEGFVRLRNAAQVDEAVRRQVSDGFDMIKVHSRLEPALYDRLLETARREKIPVVGHVIEDVGLARSLGAGQVSVEHAETVGWNGSADEDARAIARAGAWVGTIASDRGGRCAPPGAAQVRSIGALKRAGVRLLAGSDASLDPLDARTALSCELRTLVMAGLTPYEALAAATVNAGAFIRANLPNADGAFGTITPGARADMVLLPADPRLDLATLDRPLGTVLRGGWFPR